MAPSTWRIYSVETGTPEAMSKSARRKWSVDRPLSTTMADPEQATSLVSAAAEAQHLSQSAAQEVTDLISRLSQEGAQFAAWTSASERNAGNSNATLAILLPHSGLVLCLPLTAESPGNAPDAPALGISRTSESTVEVFRERSVDSPEANVIMAYEHVIHETSSDRPGTVIDLYETRIEVQQSASSPEANRGFLPMVQVEFVYRGRVTERDLGKLTIATHQRSWRGDFRRRVPDGIDGIASIYPIGWGKELTLNLDTRGAKALLSFGVDAFGLRILNREGQRSSSIRFAPLRAEVELGAELPLDRNYTLAFTFLGASSRFFDSYPQYEVFQEISLKFRERFRVWARFANEFHFGEGGLSAISLGIGYRF